MAVDVISAPGAHEITLLGKTLDGRTSLQDSDDIEFTGEGSQLPDYDHIYPEGISGYTNGTKVLHEDSVCQCKVGAWCSQDSATHAYGPGGTYWQLAWDMLN